MDKRNYIIVIANIIELYKGTIKVESTPDTGSVFTVRLPKKTNINQN